MAPGLGRCGVQARPAEAFLHTSSHHPSAGRIGHRGICQLRSSTGIVTTFMIPATTTTTTTTTTTIILSDVPSDKVVVCGERRGGRRGETRKHWEGEENT